MKRRAPPAESVEADGSKKPKSDDSSSKVSAEKSDSSKAADGNETLTIANPSPFDVLFGRGKPFQGKLYRSFVAGQPEVISLLPRF